MQTQGQALVCDLTSSQKTHGEDFDRQALKMVVKDDCVTGEPPPFRMEVKEVSLQVGQLWAQPQLQAIDGLGKPSVLREVRLYREVFSPALQAQVSGTKGNADTVIN